MNDVRDVSLRRGARVPGERRYWALFGNPRFYQVEEAVRQLTTDLWTTKGRDLRAGDRVAIWKGAGRDGYRGVIALGEVLTDPVVRPDTGNPYWLTRPAADNSEERVVVRYVIAPRLPLLKQREPDPILDALSISRATGGTVFKIEPEDWYALLSAAGGWPTTEDEIGDVRIIVDEYAGRRTFRHLRAMSAEIRKAVEMHAMQRAREHYERRGWICEDVSAKRSYDLHCTRAGGAELRIEVKGTESDGSAVLLTPNEVEHARNQHPNIALFVLANVQIVESPNLPPRAVGGTVYVLEPWAIDNGELISVGFEYRLPKGAWTARR